MQKWNLTWKEVLGALCVYWIGVQFFNGRSGFLALPVTVSDDMIAQIAGHNTLAIVCYAGAIWFAYRMYKKSL